ncbi:hypothetical protein BEWA_023850 [Theileria equi strain WA]|uniref:Uncharacterized protein n=1 Tax=Theileria equi strain WA TaxID=1537102 RepID=L0AWY7_THEEQ|nr:hypothetical protein BEWA_023850 [Theileria equi strain WA]AFZ79536.1 hypothetical protein BEWA_023850 [Theileria equi strain WA]|eukprot:XP_004829202.1 hypothetical protein BEWA_023850 [Theileria equi strain WA]
MSFVRLSSLVFVLFAVEIAAFKVNGHHDQPNANNYGHMRPYTHDPRLRDEPLILTQDPQSDDLVVSESPMYGLNRLIHDRNRRNAANEPRYRVGTTVYVRNGALRSSKGTVLYNKPMGIGEPYKVQVALDCRDRVGLVNDKRFGYHGTSSWFFEDELTDQPPNSFGEQEYNKEKPEGSDHLSRINHVDLMDSYDPRDITDIYNEIMSRGQAHKYTSFIAITQLAKAFHWRKIYSAFRYQQQLELLNHIYDVVVSNDMLDPMYLSWMIWSLGVFTPSYDAGKFTRHMDIFREVESKITMYTLTNYDQSSLAAMAWPYSRLDGSGALFLQNVANKVIDIPIEELEPSYIATISFSLYRKSIYNRKFAEHISRLISERTHNISAYEASKMLPLFSLNPREMSHTVEVLGSIIFANEGYDRKGGSVTDKTFVNLINGFSRTGNCFRMLTDYVYRTNPKLSQQTLEMALAAISDTPRSRLGSWIIEKLTRKIDKCSDKSFLLLIRYAIKFRTLPDEFIPLICERILSPFSNYELTPVTIIASFWLILSRIDHDPAMFLELAAKLDKICEHVCPVEVVQTYDITKAFYTLSLLHDNSQVNNMDLKYPNIINTCLFALRASFNILPMGYAGNYISYLTTIAPNLVNTSVTLAKEWLDNPGIDIDSYETPTIRLAEILLSVKMAFETKGFYEDRNPEPISLSAKCSLEGMRRFVMDSVSHLVDTTITSRWPFSFLQVLTRTKMINYIAREDELLQFSMNVADTITNTDLNRLVNSLKELDLYNEKWESFVHSIPRGIERVLN